MDVDDYDSGNSDDNIDRFDWEYAATPAPTERQAQMHEQRIRGERNRDKAS